MSNAQQEFSPSGRTVETAQPTVGEYQNSLRQLQDIANQYERIRGNERYGRNRTKLMTEAVSRSYTIIRSLPLAELLKIFEIMKNINSPGSRVIALAIAEVNPHEQFYPFVLRCLENSPSYFEDYHSIAALGALGMKTGGKLAFEALMALEQHVPSTESDPDRFSLVNRTIAQLKPLVKSFQYQTEQNPPRA
jgi:hypothetical protein